MSDADDLLADLQAQTRTHVHLAVIAEAAPVAEMHIDLAQFSEERVRAYREVGEDQPIGAINWSKSQD